MTVKQKNKKIEFSSKLTLDISGYLWLKFLYMIEKRQHFINFDDNDEKNMFEAFCKSESINLIEELKRK